MSTAGITGPVQLRPILNLTNAERRAAAQWTGSIVIQSSVRSAVRPNELKEWCHDRWQQVVDALRQEHRIIQIGGDLDPLLDGVEDRRGHAHGLREVAAMLSHARLFVGLESGVMHLARAADCPAVVILGGRVQPNQASYAGFTNLVRSPTCSPCWRYTGCELDRQCMRDIHPAEVIAAVRASLAHRRAPLPAMVVDLTPAEQARIVACLKP
jgi:ADP-heptose:LPS heptosyltransferase